MPTPIQLPDLGVGDEPIRVSLWLVEPGDSVEAGDRIVELLVSGLTFDVPAPVAGTLRQALAVQDEVVSPGAILGWIDEASEP